MFGFRSKFDGAGGGGGRRASQTADTVDQSEHSAYMKTGFVLIRPYSSLIGYPGIETSVLTTDFMVNSRNVFPLSRRLLG